MRQELKVYRINNEEYVVAQDVVNFVSEKIKSINSYKIYKDLSPFMVKYRAILLGDDRRGGRGNKINLIPKNVVFEYLHLDSFDKVETKSDGARISINDAKEIYSTCPHLRKTLLKDFTDTELGIIKPLVDDVHDLENIVGYTLEGNSIARRVCTKFPNKIIFPSRELVEKAFVISKLHFLYQDFCNKRGLKCKYDKRGAFLFDNDDDYKEFTEKYRKHYAKFI